MVKNCGIYAKNNYNSSGGNFNGSTKKLYLNSNLSSLSMNAVKKFNNKYGSELHSGNRPNMTSLNITNEDPSKLIYNFT